jgi:imidazolonepropionase-like amidohydrolase
MSQPNATDCLFEQILGFMLPFFLAAAGGDATLARDAILELLHAYDSATATELELAGRIVGFSTVAMDNLRLSMKPDLSDAQILRYRSNAVVLSRAAEQCRTILEVMQGKRKPLDKPLTVPRPAIAPAPEIRADKAGPADAKQPPITVGGVPMVPADLEAMRQGARVMLGAFAKGGLSDQAAAPFPRLPETAAMVTAAVKEAIGASKRSAAA